MFEGNIFGRLDQKLQHAVADAGYSEPTPIQAKAIPALLDGRDLIGCAQTGTGKTAAFMLPILNRLVRERKARRIGHPRALILSPTRELAAQTARNAEIYSKYCNLPLACVFGGVSQYGQVKDIKKGAETIVACPGRLIDLMTQGIVFLESVECFVLDEADRMLDMGFLPDIKRIMSKLPVRRQSLFFSATMPPAVRKLAGELVRDPVEITIAPEKPAVEQIDQMAIFAEKPCKDAILMALLAEHPEWTKVMVFAKMRHGADRIVKKLLRAGTACAAIHSDKTQNQRTRALEAFRRGENRVLVATDIASRGIDVPDISCVINMDLPLETENYIHRIGRTARAGGSGTAVSLVSNEEKHMLKAVERLMKKSVRVVPAPKTAVPAPACQGAGADGAKRQQGGNHPVGGGRRGKGRGPRQKRKRGSNLGFRQSDFRRKNGNGLP